MVTTKALDNTGGVGPVETVLTPELAARLLAHPHPNQRRAGRQKVVDYTRAIKEGRWRLVPDALMVDPEGRMFNGGHRCAAVIAANRAIPVYIAWDADSSLFDVIDIGRYRSPFQFVNEKQATAKASAARVTLWYERRFERPLHGSSVHFDLHEILQEVERRSESFDAVDAAATAIYEYTSIAKSVTYAAFAIAHELGYQDEIEAFVEGVRDPHYLPETDPARLLSERFRKQTHRARRREMVADWTLLVYAFNLHLEGKELGKLILSDVWPRVAESSSEYRRRQNSVHSQRSKKRAVLTQELRQTG